MMTLPCLPESFNGVSLFGAEVLSIAASLVTNHTVSVPISDRFTQPPVEVQNATFCNVTVTYTHPGQGDTVAVEAWLPPAGGWNGRLQAVGGAGWVAGRSDLTAVAMAGAVSDGYATVTTDAGLQGAQDSEVPWALLSPGNVNLYALQNLASVSLDDEAIIAKSLIKAYYGRGPDYSYWNGCSQGGRQGLMLAQRYPTAYDGIAAGAPPLHWTNNLLAMLWPQQFMSMLGEYPYPCEIQAITAAATSACDGLDGLVDGVINEMEECLASFDPFGMVGQAITDCAETSEISQTAAAVVNATWQGMRTSQGTHAWPGPNPGTDLAIGVANTDCASGSCVGVLPAVAVPWVTQYIARGAELDLTNLTHAEFDELVHQGQQRYRSIIDTDDVDLSAFRDVGGKLVTYHGLIDQLLPPQGTLKYYDGVSALLPDVHDFYRHFEVPGMGHCSGGGPSGNPITLFDQLRAWVENGTAPDSAPVRVTDLEGTVGERILCPYPQKAIFDQDCGAAGEGRCWSCK
ncbi:Tannase/feruloyl esterase [Chaetomium fimeti]|uniref:Carboxylic ester hydrolase n=1 Tax=Chaetomium fimeti TaxID=1854472 RepID=A0AAE0LMJ5_9PEZI|nr:Tannase/feruloyl esterase [Chaetomium fimeti]